MHTHTLEQTKYICIATKASIRGCSCAKATRMCGPSKILLKKCIMQCFFDR